MGSLLGGRASHESSAVGTPGPALMAQDKVGRDLTAAAAISSQDPVSCSVQATRGRRQPPGANPHQSFCLGTEAE